MVGEVGLEPTKAKPADLQSAPFAARDIPPIQGGRISAIHASLSTGGIRPRVWIWKAVRRLSAAHAAHWLRRIRNALQSASEWTAILCPNSCVHSIPRRQFRDAKTRDALPQCGCP